MKEKTIKPVGYIKSDFTEKFGIPRQSGRAPSCVGEIILTGEFNNPDTVRDLEKFSHLWLLFDFSKCKGKWSALVRPPRLGGNKKVGVFASRSPFRPNGIGLSLVKLENVSADNNQVIITVSGIDLLDGTPIYDIKPYLPTSESVKDAVGGYADGVANYKLRVDFPTSLQNQIPKDKLSGLIECLEDDPRPAYQDDEREYGMAFAGKNVKFCVENGVLRVISVE